MANTVPYKPRVWPTDPKDAHLQNTQEFQRISNALQDINNQLGSGGGSGGGTSFPTSTVPWAIQGGTANAMTATYSTITTLADGQLVGLRKVGTNAAGAVTLAINGGTAHTVVLNAFGPSGIVGTFVDTAEMLLRWNAGSNEWVCVNEPFVGVQEAGGAGQLGGNKVFLGWTGAHPSLVIDVTNVGNIVTDNPSFSTTLMPAVHQMMFPSMPSLVNGNANVVNQGADPTGSVDATSIIQNTMNTYGIAYLPKGLFKISSTLVLPLPGTSPTGTSATGLIGEGIANTVLFTSNTTTDMIQFHNSSPGNYRPVVKGMSITRNAGIATTGYGINTAPNDTTNTYDHALLEDLYLSNHSIGLHLGGANPGWSYCQRVHSESNRFDGFEIHGTWELLDLFATVNGRDGFRVDASNAQSCGQWRGLSTFGNSGVGFNVVGNSTGTINGIRLSDSFFGADGAQEIFLDSWAPTNSSVHVFNNVYCESPGQVTANSNCIDITGNNPDVSFINCVASASGTGRALNDTGISTLIVQGGQYITTGSGTAIAVTGGKASIMGVIARSNTGTGIACVAPATAASVIGCNASGGAANVINTVATAFSTGNYP